ncbi:NAD(P)/FAD-dependent oxidoreductase [Aspergillus clavatus NRRL 1]|uniref:FAD dependent oxidoreductase, putative n=1 Tax=Aspergillus clavatus (strain ATCC 1007 / CBS 513.65 / DSM 816 / NCTC 3887 / NRRL 1 / QM 1276 / 107) TaxID=344612 RepID=A1CUI1_ASPCL|nr:FAD dependent oxidoreductase, putative [Aspergillus clavatus NRRL 1]EAW06968.1 FAD dependent oxidoreductase, putative [Aspergillus clavatus NRRL 1]
MAFVQALLSNPTVPAEERQKALDRAFSDPGLPTTKPTTSFWLRNPHPTLAQAQSSNLPSEAEVVIIGSGVAGASIARTLLKSRKPGKEAGSRPAVVILEARDVCSGATGRNGGHILETAEEFVDLEESIGLEAAKITMRFRMAHLKELLKTADEFGLTEESQARKVQFLSVYFDEEGWKAAVPRLKRLKECLPEEAAEWRSYDKDEVPKEFCLPRARGIIAGPAGAVWPYKLVTGILDRLQKKHPEDLRIETNTPVTGIQDNSSQEESSLRYSVETTRGTIRARHIVHCTNAHTGHLVPGLRGRIYPVRGQMSAQNPGSKFRGQGAEHSWIFNYEKGFDYLTQLPSSKRTDAGEMMMFGGGFAHGEGGGIGDFGIPTDSELSLYADIHLSGALSAIFGRENWGSVPGESVEQMWTGSLGFSSDGFPWVGKLPKSLTQRGEGKEEGGSEWISAAFSGEGMVLAWLSGKALGTMLLAHDNNLAETESADLSWVPEQMLVTEDRVEKAVLPRKVDFHPSLSVNH